MVPGLPPLFGNGRAATACITGNASDTYQEALTFVLEHASKCTRMHGIPHLDNETFVAELVSLQPFAFRFASERLRSDATFVKQLVMHNPNAMNGASYNLKRDAGMQFFSVRSHSKSPHLPMRARRMFKLGLKSAILWGDQGQFSGGQFDFDLCIDPIISRICAIPDFQGGGVYAPRLGLTAPTRNQTRRRWALVRLGVQMLNVVLYWMKHTKPVQRSSGPALHRSTGPPVSVALVR